MFGVALDERFDEGCFANLCAVSMIVNNRADFVYPRRTDDGDNDRRRFFWQTVDQGNVQSLFFDLDIREYWLDRDNKMYRTSCERAACFCRRPGLAKAKAFGFVPIPSISTRYNWKERCQRTPSVLFLFFRLPVRPICLVLHRRNGTTMRCSCSQVSSQYPIRSSNFPCQGPSGRICRPEVVPIDKAKRGKWWGVEASSSHRRMSTSYRFNHLHSAPASLSCPYYYNRIQSLSSFSPSSGPLQLQPSPSPDASRSRLSRTAGCLCTTYVNALSE